MQEYKTAGGVRWRVRWRTSDGTMKSRSWTSLIEAEADDKAIQARKRRGDLVLDQGNRTLADAFSDWKELIAPDAITDRTLRQYEGLWRTHVEPYFEHRLLRDFETDRQLFQREMKRMGDRLRAEAAERGDTSETAGNAVRRKVMWVLSGVFRAAVEWGWMGWNPALTARKPAAKRASFAQAFPPILIERIRAELMGRQELGASHRSAVRDACLVSVLAYAGLRPAEALALRWSDIGEDHLSVERAVVEGKMAPTKTGRPRKPPLLPVLAEDLADWRAVCGNPPAPDLVFPDRGGEPWSDTAFRNWRRRVWRPALQRLAEPKRKGTEPLEELLTARLYDCRGSFVSLQLRGGASPLEVADWAGHSPQVMYTRYARHIERLVGRPRATAEKEVRAARETLRTKPEAAVQELVTEAVEELRQEPPEAARGLLFGRRMHRLAGGRGQTAEAGKNAS